MGAAVVERTAVRVPGWEHLKLRRVVLEVGHLALVDVVGDDVARQVVHLNLVGVGGVETLEGLVGRIDDELQPWVPGGIDASREDRVVFQVHLLDLSVVGDDGTTPLLTGMELHALWVILLVVMTVDALSLDLEATEPVIVDDALVVVLETALADGEGLVADERRGDETIAQIGVDTIRRHMDGERLVVRPLVAVLHIHIDTDITSLCRQFLPLAQGGLHLILAHHLDTVSLIACYHAVGLSIELEGQRGDVLGDGHIDDVGIDLRQFLTLDIALWDADTAGC